MRVTKSPDGRTVMIVEKSYEAIRALQDYYHELGLKAMIRIFETTDGLVTKWMLIVQNPDPSREL
jgi:hypothetical protein